jgi:hypothetical protein
MIHARVEQSNLDFSIMFHNVQFFPNKHNSQSDHWIGLMF